MSELNSGKTLPLTSFMGNKDEQKKHPFKAITHDYYPGAVRFRVKLHSSGKDSDQLRINVPTNASKVLGLTVDSKVTVTVYKENR